jgi:hypothetical protein
MKGAASPSAETCARGWHRHTSDYRRVNLRLGLAPEHAHRADDGSDVTGSMKRAERADKRHEHWCHVTNWESLPPTRKEPHRSLPPCKVRRHALRMRDGFDYRWCTSRMGSPRWGVFDSRQYLGTQYERLTRCEGAPATWSQPTSNQMPTPAAMGRFAAGPGYMLRIVTWGRMARLTCRRIE